MDTIQQRQSLSALLLSGSDEKCGGEKKEKAKMFPNSPMVLGPNHLEFIEKYELHTQGEFFPFVMHDYF